MLIPTTVPNLMKFGSFVLQGRWGIGKGVLFFSFPSWRWHHLLILPVWRTVSSNKPSNWLYIYKTLWQNDCRRLELCCKTMEEIQMASWFFFFPSNRFVPDVWILIISLGLNSRHNIDFCLMREREWGSTLAMVFTGNVLPLLPNLSRQNQKSCFPNEPLSHPLFWTQFLSPH